MDDLLEQVAGLAPMGGNLSPMVEVTHLGSMAGEYDLVHLVNGSSHFGTSFFPPISMHEVRMDAPLSVEPSAVYSLVTGEAYNHEWQASTLTIHIPILELFDAIRIVL